MERDFEVTKMSSKGQVVIPQRLRDRMHIKEGSKFAVVGMDDTIILKKLEPPKWEDFDRAVGKLRKLGKEKDISEKAVEKAVKESRKR
jgi:AbrB family looped-hinge helix DNA binding protein